MPNTTTPRKKKTAAAIELPTMLTEDLRIALSNALHFAGTDGTLPVINTVLLEFDGTTLTVVGTDRYTLGIATTPCSMAKGEFLLKAVDARDLAALLKSRKPRKKTDGQSSVDLSIDGDRLTATFGGITVAYVRQDGTYPNYRRLVADIEKKEVTPEGFVALNARMLARFAAVQGGWAGEPMHLTFGSSTDAVRIKIGDRFTGVQMPVRLSDEQRAAA